MFVPKAVSHLLVLSTKILIHHYRPRCMYTEMFYAWLFTCPVIGLDLAQHFLVKNGITAIRRIRKTDNNRIARACGATIANRTEELKEEDVGTGAGLFEIKKFGDE